MAKKFDVYGIGNALVDMEFEVTADFLNTAGIEKGLMTLVDEARQTEIVSHLAASNHKRSCGGSAANTMIAISQFGGKSFYSCKVASDETGDFYFKDLMDNGVETNLSTSSLESGITGKCIVLVTPDADRTMNTFLGITQNFSTKELIEEHIKNSNYLYIEGYLVPSPSGKEACLKAKKLAETHGVKTALTFSDVNMITYFEDGMKEIVGNGVDLLFCNEAEAHAYTKSNDLNEAVVALKKIAKTFAITLGPKGALVFDGQELIQIETKTVKPVDTNGAGDLFAGAMLFGINNGMSFKEAAKLGCYASSTLVTQFGPRLRKEQIAQVKAELA
ncbi:adenosine kinase [Bacteriovorax sp. PP10]|uniref:Adenosine kinase n=1 Tax=Bacteriovorax antarcticus TaxID=3088717 RepID=A0ABU5VZ37_9BACT|nr:adenosine kinase [Bacteriovorax sp. PP10]MEA9358331.1 adenosine kinase [Bacteriovorax sp. PP10]